MNTFTITDKNRARDIISDFDEEFSVIEEEIQDQGRWSTHYRVVVKRLSDEKFFATTFSRGSTEYQDESPFEYSDAVFTEVFETEKTIRVYE